MKKADSEKEIGKAIQQHFIDFCEICPKEDFHIVNEDGVFFFSSVYPYAFFNRVVATNTNEANLPTKILNVKNYYKARGLPFMWMTWEGLDEPVTLNHHLEQHGFKVMGTSYGMGLNLNQLEECEYTIEGFKIKEVQTEEDFSQFIKIIMTGFRLTEEMGNAFKKMITLQKNDRTLGSNYVGYLNGEPVASSSVFYLSGVAGIYNVVTLEQARGKGIGQAMTHFPTFQAKLKGYESAILHSSELGHNVYKKLGFKDYFNIGIYT